MIDQAIQAKSESVYELSEVEVETLGLVSRGANREEFFLLKGEKMDTPDLVVEETTHSVLDFLSKLFRRAVVEAETVDPESEVIKASFSDVPWSSPESDLSPSDFCAVCLIDTNSPSEEKLKKNCHLPVKRTPDGPYVKAALRNAAARLNQVQGISSEMQMATKRKLARLMTQAGMATSLAEKAEALSGEAIGSSPASSEVPVEAEKTDASPDPIQEQVHMEHKVESAVQPQSVVPTPEVEKREPTKEVPVIDVTAVEKRQAELEKANQELLARLEKAEKTAAEERELRERQVYLAKAQSYGTVPIAASELADQLYWLVKTDAKRAQWWEDLLKAMDAQIADSGLFVEKGTSTVSDAVEQAMKAADPKAAVLGLSKADAEAYLRAHRKALREA